MNFSNHSTFSLRVCTGDEPEMSSWLKERIKSFFMCSHWSPWEPCCRLQSDAEWNTNTRFGLIGTNHTCLSLHKCAIGSWHIHYSKTANKWITSMSEWVIPSNVANRTCLHTYLGTSSCNNPLALHLFGEAWESAMRGGERSALACTCQNWHPNGSRTTESNPMLLNEVSSHVQVLVIKWPLRAPF